MSSRALGPLVTMLAIGCSLRHAEVDVAYQGDAWPSTRPVHAVGPEAMALVPNSAGDTLTLLDLGKGTVVASAPVGLDPIGANGPHFAAFDAARRYAYVTLQFPPPVAAGPHAAHGSSTRPGALLKVRTSDLAIESVVRLGTNPADFAFTPDGGRIVVAHFDLARAMAAAAKGLGVDEMRSTVAIVDVASMRVVAAPSTCIAPHGVTMSADGRRAFVACYGEDAIAVVDVTDEPRVTLWPLAGALATPSSMTLGPMVAALGPDPRALLVSETEGKELRVLDTEDGTTKATISVRGVPFLPASSTDGTQWVVPVQMPDRLVIVSSATWTITRQVELAPTSCTRPHMVGRSGDRWFVVCEGDHVGAGTVVELDADLNPVRTLETGAWPNMMAMPMP